MAIFVPARGREKLVAELLRRRSALVDTRDIADVHVVIGAKREQPIVTSDADDLLRLDPSASLVRI